jgi:pimeloyl-ACP methyl ester carboxylesterase
MPFAAVNGLRLYYEEEGTGPPLVLLNASTLTIDDSNRGGWAALRPYLARRYRVIHVEQRGHGRTDNPGGGAAYTRATLAADAVALLEQLGLAPAHVVGWSEGGLVGLELALAHAPAVRSVIGIGAWYTPDAKFATTVQELAPERMEREQPARAALLTSRHDPHQTPGYWRDLLGWITTSLAEARTAEALQRIAVPTLWIAGENDPWFELDQLVAMKRHIPGAELLIVNHAEHGVQLTHPDLVGPVIADFLSRNEAPRRP